MTNLFANRKYVIRQYTYSQILHFFTMLVKLTKGDLVDFLRENRTSHVSDDELADLLMKHFELQGNLRVWCVMSKSNDAEIVGVFSESGPPVKIKNLVSGARTEWRTIDSLESKVEHGAKLFELQIARDGTVDFITNTNQYKTPVAGISKEGKFRIFGSFWGVDEDDATREAIRFMEKNDFPFDLNSKIFDPSVGAIFYTLKYIE